MKTSIGKEKVNLFESKLENVVLKKDPLRPEMQYVYIDEFGCVNATDTHIGIIQDLALHGWTGEEAEYLKGKFISVETIKQTNGSEWIKILQDGIEFKKGVVESKLPFPNNDWKYPNLRSVVPETIKGFDGGIMAFNTKLLAKLSSAMLYESTIEGAVMLRCKEDRRIVATTDIPWGRQKTIIMQVLKDKFV